MNQRISICLSLLVILSFVTILSTGCSTHVAYTYPLDRRIQVIDNSPPDVKIAVLPAQDYRGTKNKSAALFFASVPLFPYGWMKYERPEAATTFVSIGEFDMEFKEDIAKSVAEHFQEAGVAKRVFFDYGGLVDTADYKLQITVYECLYNGKVFSYLVGPFRGILWMFGLPIGSSSVTLNMELKLEDKNGDIVWDKEIDERWGKAVGIFYGQGRDMEGLARSLQQALEMLLANDPPDLEY